MGRSITCVLWRGTVCVFALFMTSGLLLLEVAAAAAAAAASTAATGTATAGAPCSSQEILSPENSLSLSSQLLSSSSNAQCGPAQGEHQGIVARAGDGRLNAHIGCGGWIPSGSNSTEYWQVDFLQPELVTQLTVQGFVHRYTGQSYSVTSLRVLLSNDSVHFTAAEVGTPVYRDVSSASAVAVFDIHVVGKRAARYVRLTHLSRASAPHRLGMRVGLYVCGMPASMKAMAACNKPLGLALDSIIPDSAFTSSSYDHYEGSNSSSSITSNNNDTDRFAPYQARIRPTIDDDGSSAWCADSNATGRTYLQIDLGQSLLISALELEGYRDSNGTGPLSGYHGVDQFSVLLSNSRGFSHDFDVVVRVDFLGNEQVEVFTGPQQPQDPQPLRQAFLQPLRARFVRLVGFGSRRTVCVRMEMYGCKPAAYDGPELPLVHANSPTVEVSTVFPAATTHRHSTLGKSLTTGTRIGIATGVLCVLAILGSILVMHTRYYCARKREIARCTLDEVIKPLRRSERQRLMSTDSAESALIEL
ncbi:neuropilin-2-like [Sycon ciliatum]|uniref:neuropilin-2-like n=1 Tax=Sycon ciliatum TaxID=27933 RepID=UPI0020A95A00